MEINTNTNINNIGYLLHMESQKKSGTDTESQKSFCGGCEPRKDDIQERE